ncbi:TonB-dependent receptor domain-containing protein [Tsuneonella sp. HG249]
MSAYRLRAVLLLSAATLSAPALAQETVPAPIGEPEGEADIVVTGTRIEGAKTTEALPVVVLNEDRLDATGSTSGDDLFRSIPQAGDVQFQESRTTGNLNDARGDNASVNLRNLGTGNTLVLLNGRRMILTPGTQTENFVPVQTANTNSLPVGSIRRIEVLLDGAAALYGSDAVAGVVNVVTDTRFEGVRVAGRYGWADGFSEATAAAKAGFMTDSGGRYVISASYLHRTPLFASERPYSASENHLPALVGTPFEGDTSFDNRSTSGPYGGFVAINAAGNGVAVRQGTTAVTTATGAAIGAFHVQPSTYTPTACSSSVYGGVCLRTGAITGAVDRPLRYDENPDRTIRGELDRYTGYAGFEQPLGSIELFGEANYYHAVLDGQREQSAPISSAVITVPNTNYWNPFGATTINGVANPNRLPNLVNVPAAGLAVRIANYRPVDTGPRTFTVTDDMFRGVLGLRGDLGVWKWESAVTYAEAKTVDNTHNAVSATLLQQQLALSTPDAYNPFNGGSDPAYSIGDARPSSAASIAPFLVEVYRIGKTSLATADLRINTADLFALPGGNVGMAAGIEWRRETFKDDRDDRLDGTTTYRDSVTGISYGTDIIGASGAPDVGASRNVWAAYAELALPLVSPEMNVPLVSAFDVQLAGRYERYSDFGDVAKPKVAALWELLEGFKLRGSWSKSFRAPNLPQFYSDGATVSNTRTDFGCRTVTLTLTCPSASTLEVRAGNDQLQPENSTNLTGGVVIEPRRWLTLNWDWWQIKSNGVIGITGAQNQILYDLLLRRSGSSNPNVVRLPVAAGQVVGTIDYVQDNYFNLGPRVIEGWDAHVGIRTGETGIGRFELNADLAKLTKLQQSPSDLQQQLIDANAQGLLGPNVAITRAGDLVKQGGNPRWRWALDALWRSGPVTFSTLVSSVGEVFDTGSSVVNGQFYRVPRWTTVSSYVQYSFDEESPIGQARLRLGVRNLFDKDPPLTSSNYGFNGALHNPSGRFWYVDISKTF